MKFWEDKEKMLLLIVFIIALAFLMGMFVGRISARNIYYLG